MDQKTVTKLRGWMQKYGTWGTLMAGCYLALHSLRTRRRTVFVLSAVGTTGICALLLCLYPRQTTRKIVPPRPVALAVAPRSMNLDKALLDAVREKDLSRVQAAVAAGANVDACDDKGYSALMLAADGNQEEMIRFLLAHDADDGSLTEATALSIAVGHKNASIVRLLLEAMPSRQKQEADAFPAGLLGQACADGSNEIVRLLIAHGAQMNDFDGLTPLSVAADNDHPETIDLLLSLGADLDAENAREGSALFWVAGKGDLPMVKFLVARGADVNYRSQHESILQNAVKHPAVIRFLLSHGAEVDLLGKGDMTPLADAAAVGNAESVRILLAHGADVNHIAERDGTALNSAAFRGHTNIVKILLRWGADVKLRSKDPYTHEAFETALQTAQENHHPDIVRLLKQAGARE